MPTERMNFVKRITEMARTFDPGGCWEWIGRTNRDGYGHVTTSLDARGLRVWRAHCAAYTVLVGPVADGMELDHLCRNRRCMNPSHLQPVAKRVNILRGVSLSALNARKTHCKRGHEFTPENTYIVKRPKRGLGDGVSRQCKTCTLHPPIPPHERYLRRKQREARHRTRAL